MKSSRIRFTVILFTLGLLSVILAAAESPPNGPSTTFDNLSLEFFEKEVRPLLIKRCFECHSGQAKELQGGLRLDSRAAALKGGDTGAAIVPHNSKKSLLVDAINYGDVYQMPPKSQMPKEEIAILTKWVELGAPWPDDSTDTPVNKESAFDLAARKAAHWAWRPIQLTSAPTIKDSAWPAGEIDRFILARLEEKELSPAAASDKRALIRRAYFDIVGLPPAPEAVERFIADDSPQAFERVVDELLASPRFGERWARHWLDLVRYAETHGHEYDYPIEHAWPYRDYVIRALNADVPYDQFAVEHIAGDLLDKPRLHPTEKFNESIIGTGFWWFGEQVHAPVDVLLHEADRVDNQIDVLGKTFLGLTLGCARCHDHKFDAISTADIYSLWGFAKSTRLQTAYLDPNGKIAAAAKEIAAIQRDPTWASLSETRKRVSERRDHVFAEFDGDDFAEWFVSGEAFGDRPTRAGDWTSRNGKPHPLAAGTAHSGCLSNKLTGALRSKNFTIEKPAIAYRIAGKNAQVRLIIQGYRMDVYNPLLFSGCSFKVDHEELKWHMQAADVRNHVGKRAYLEILDDGDGWVAVDEIRFVDADWKAPDDHGSDSVALAGSPPPESDALHAAAVKIEAISKEIPQPMRVLAATDGEAFDDRVHIRGNAKMLGETTPRRFLTALAGDNQPVLSTDAGSGRLELARRITDRDNPLFARAMVNRVWQHLFGRGIVATVDNFGVLGEPPSHPELLDHLAVHFRDDGYSIKRLIRTIVLSRTYQMTSRADAKADEIDPDNLLVHRQNIRRLEGEVLRDSVLALAGRLDLTMYGPPVKVHLTPFMTGFGRPKESGPLDGANRRSIYQEVRRNYIASMMLAFDTPPPSGTIGRRNVSNVPAQALIMMNDPFVAEQAKQWAERLLKGSAARTKDEVQSTKEEDDGAARRRIDVLYHEAFARPPSNEELRLAIDFIKAQAGEHGESPWEDSAAAWADLCHTLFNTKEFLFVE